MVELHCRFPTSTKCFLKTSFAMGALGPGAQQKKAQLEGATGRPSGGTGRGRIRVLVLRWARSRRVANRHEHKRVLNLSVISQSKHQTFIVITEEIRKLGNTTAKVHEVTRCIMIL